MPLLALLNIYDHSNLFCQVKHHLGG